MRLHCLYILLLLWGLAGGAAVFGYERQPNIVILLSDDLGWGDLGCYGGSVLTPSIDRLAREGTRFTNFYAGAAVCSPSRAVLLTGRTNVRTSIFSWINDYEQRSHLPQSEVTLAELLNRRGYETAHFGKWHLGLPTPKFPNKPTPRDHGFDYWFATANNAQSSHHHPKNFIRNGTSVGATQGYACDLVVDEAISWLDNRAAGEKPFFLNVWFHEPHAPLAAPQHLINAYGNQDDPAAVYSATIANTDQAIGRLVEKIHSIADPENTLIIYSSDNGSYRTERVGGLRGTKGSNYEGGIRVPGVFYWPEHISAERVENQPAGLVDLLPTICAVSGVELPPLQLDGTDLLPLLVNDLKDGNRIEAESFKRRKPLFWYLPLSGPAVAVRDGPYCLVAFRAGGLPKDTAAIKAIKDRIESHLRAKGILSQETRGSTLAQQLFEGFHDSEAERMRGHFIRLNQFQETWIPKLKEVRFSQFELYNLDEDPTQQVDISVRQPLILARLKSILLKHVKSASDEAFDWSSQKKAPTNEPSDKIHRFQSEYRSPFDAMVYLNRIPIKPDALEVQTELASRIQSRLSNQEGRIQIKLPPTFSPAAYEGFKIAVGIGENQTSCISCHQLPEFGDYRQSRSVPTFRNRGYTQAEIRRVFEKAVHKGVSVDESGRRKLLVFLETLTDVPVTEFRSLILNATVMDPGKEPE